ncbi:MAG: hypothetical protein GF353_24850 [Candidatus Lokiarchaeota archaeon]|nr:hypothetical protein [Candidatus Lokiarchaeota archaeon]
MELVTYSNPNHGITISYPRNWEILEDYMGMTLAILSPQESEKDDFRENLIVQVTDLEGVPFTLDDFSHASIENLKQVITKIKIIGPQTPTTVAGTPGRKIIYRGVQGNFKLQWLTMWTLKNGNAYILTFTAKRRSFDKYLPLFENLAATFIIF